MIRFGHGKGNQDIRQTPERCTPDAELVHATHRGDKRAFVEIVARHQAMVCGIALGILGDFAASEDAAQEAFLTAWRKFHDLREPERLRPWLAQIARNAALGYLRRKRGEDPLDAATLLPDDAPTPDEAAANEEEAALVRESLAKLPETYRLPLILYYREGQSVRAVAEALGITEDAVKQRLARGREMLRDRISGVIETVLTRTTPTAIFTMTIAVAIGALAAPAAIAGTVFAAASAASASTAATSTTSSFLTAMSTSKAFLVATALVAVMCIPIGYQIHTGPPTDAKALVQVQSAPEISSTNAAPAFADSTLFAEWRELHLKHGTNAAAMPVLYKAIAGIKDTFRRRAFRAALIAEWVQVDPASGLAFILGKGSDEHQRRQFFDEWFARDPNAAVDGLLAAGSGWEEIARGSLTDIARRLPARLTEIVSRLPKAEWFYDRAVSDAFSILAEAGLTSARKAAEAVTGPNRDQALGGIAKIWAKTDFNAAVEWARGLPEGTDRDDVIRTALLGRAAVDPVGALDSIGLVPPGGRPMHFNSTTAARVLAEAAKTDFDAAVGWVAAHPGRLARDDMYGLGDATTERLNADPVGFLATYSANGALAALLPAIDNALLNGSSGQEGAIWEWLKKQPDSGALMSLKEEVLQTAGFREPATAMRMVADLPRGAEGDAYLKTVASALLNGGYALHRFDNILEQAPERLRQPYIELAFKYLSGAGLDDPQRWIERLSLLPEASQVKGTESIARAWAQRAPEEAIDWAASLPSGDGRNAAMAAIASAWAKKDAYGAADWLASMPPGPERDRSAGSLVSTVADQHPREAWEWALSIQDSAQRSQAAEKAAKVMAARDPATARQWIESGPFSAETRSQLQSTIELASRLQTQH